MNFKLQITTEHVKNSSGYPSNTDCPLAVALKEIFPKHFITVGGIMVSIGGFNYLSFNHWDWNILVCEEMEQGLRADPVEITIKDFPEELARQAKILIS